MNKFRYVLIIVVLILVVIIGIVGNNKNNNKNVYVRKDDSNQAYDINTEDEEDSDVISINRYSLVSDIVFDSDKINIYFFWGNGCPHCEEMFEYLESIKDDYGKYYNVYAFEVWYDENNGSVMDYFLDEFDKSIGNRGVPVYIIGDVYFEGFSSNMEEEILDTIMSEYEDRENVRDFSEVMNFGK